MEKANIGFKAGIIFEKLGETGLITIAEANSCENNKIYNVKASVNISNDLLTNAKYNGSFTYSYEGTAENIASNSFDKGDLSVSEWKQYAVSDRKSVV